jgi:predicted NUDIX family NTP pyrophosphohydrolase
MAAKSAGILVYRRAPDGLQVFLVHPGGPFWAKKDLGAWSIPKGEFEEAEDGLTAARREFLEEIGQEIDGKFIELTPIRQPGRKMVYAWAIEGDVDADNVKSNEFELEWPPKSGRKQRFPEVDRGAWFALDEARSRIMTAQQPLLEELAVLLGTEDSSPAKAGA